MTKHVVQLGLLAFLCALTAGCDSGSSHSGHSHYGPNDDVGIPVVAVPREGAECIADRAGNFPCNRVDLVAGLSFNVRASDLWGWHDEQQGVDYALVGLSVGTAFVRLQDPAQPEFIAFLPTDTESSSWRDVKVLDHYALIVSEAEHHGLQVFDLRRLADLEQYTVVQADAHYHEFSEAHNVAVNQEIAVAYAVGTDTCNGGLHIVDMAEPLQPQFAGCYGADGYTHDAQCVTYSGPDTRYLGRDLCFAANVDTLTIIDVSDSRSPALVARVSYVGSEYAHQGWLTEDQRFFLLGDEFDEERKYHNTRTYVWDLTDLRNPLQTFEYTATTAATDHNLYVSGDHVFQANYHAGVRVLRHGNLAAGELTEVGFFDTVPLADDPVTEGAWSVFPYFAQGLMVTANTHGDFFVLRSRVEELPRCSDGLDNDSDGLLDELDQDCESADDQTE